MTIRTAEVLRKNLEKVKSDNEQRIEKLEKRIAEFEAQKANPEALKRELAQAKTVAARSEEIAEKALKAAEARELEQAQAAEANRKRVSAELESRQKVKAEHAWIGAGGDPKQFESSWPTMREELLKQAVISQAANEEATRTLVTSL